MIICYYFVVNYKKYCNKNTKKERLVVIKREEFLDGKDKRVVV